MLTCKIKKNKIKIQKKFKKIENNYNSSLFFFFFFLFSVTVFFLHLSPLHGLTHSPVYLFDFNKYPIM